MAEQNANAVAITGGTISGVTIPASNVTGTLGVPNGGTGATTLTGYVKGAGTSALTAAATIPNTDITGLGTASTKDAGAALGVATLDAGGKVPVSELPAAVLGALSYQGTWDASTNTPTLTSSVGSKGYYYVVSVAGNTNLNGITDWLVGDWAVFNGSIWQKVDNTETVTSVNGQTGAVVLTTTNVAEGTNLYYTDARARGAISAGTGISYNSTTGVVTNAAPDQTVVLTGGTGISTSGTYPSFTVTNTAPDQTVALSSGTGISVTGTYPTFTVTNTAPSSGGTVTSVTGTAPVVSSGGNTPAISMPAATTSVNGYLTSTDWNTFNNKTSNTGTVTSVGGTGTVNGITLTGTVTTSGNLTLGGTLSGVSLTTQVTGTLPLGNGGTGGTTAATARTGIGATTVGGNFFTLTNPSAITFPRMNADNTVSALDAASFRTAIGAGTGSGTVTSVGASVPAFLSVSGSPITTSGTLAISYSGTALPVANGGTGFTTGYRLFQSEFTTSINANTNRTVGAYGSYGFGATNTPTNSGILYSFTSGSDGSGDGGQFWQDYVTNNLYLRQRWGGSYGSWTQFLTTTGNAATATTATNQSGGTVSATTISASGGITATSAAPFFLNATTVSANFTIPASFNASSAGPITINTGVTVTVSTGSSWVVV
jgi:hypothetical protein